eukprot:Hpha_TRINITY_DN15478_c3_g6::TRINITY_DN15478_c3_g6_i2::g.174239::m.174239
MGEDKGTVGSEGREYCVDSTTGRVIPVRAPDPERLPGRRLDMRVQVEAEGEAKANAEEPTKPTRGGISASSQRKPKRRPEAGKKWAEFVQPEDSHGPLVEGCQPTGGVMLKEGDRTFRQDLKTNKSKMSRSDYKKMLQAQGVSREAMDMTQEADKKPGAAGTPATKPQQAPRRNSRLAAGAGPAAVQQQRQPPPVASPTPAPRGDASKGELPPPQLKPQSVAIRPQYRHDKEELLGSRTAYPRDRTAPRSPRGASPRASSPLSPSVSPPRSRQAPIVQTMPGVEDNEAAQDFFADLRGDTPPL